MTSRNTSSTLAGRYPPFAVGQQAHGQVVADASDSLEDTRPLEANDSVAILHPDPPFADAASSELRVRRSLKSLSDDWHVFHHVRWQSVRAGRPGDGEADFVLVHRAHGIVVVEVKGGRIEVVDGRWYATDRENVRHVIKDPYEQAVVSKHALLTFLKPLLPHGRVPPLCHLVVFPDGAIDASVGLHPRAITWEASELANAQTALDGLLAHWNQASACSMTRPELEAIVSRLAPTVSIRRNLRTEVSTSEADLLLLTERQVSLLSHLRRVRRCITTGGAGTGKTVLALEKARLLARDGARVLLACFNAPLAAHLQKLAPDRVTVSTFHAYAHSLSRRVGVPIAGDTPDAVAQKIDELTVALSAHPEERFDAIVIDEAQDFAASWIRFLDRAVLVREGFFYVFADPHQQLYGRDYAEPEDCVPFELTQNCRNTLPIARVVARSLGDEAPSEGTAGPDVSFVEASADEIGIAQSVVDDLLVREQMTVRDVVVLCRARAHVEALLRRTTSTSSFVESVAKNGVLVDTIHRFKGLESAVVVLVVGTTVDATSRALLYVGASRARSFLVVIASSPTIRALQEGPR